MSSPLARSDRHLVKDAVVGLHRKVSHHHRIAVLARELARRIHPGQETAAQPTRCIDLGCGDMTLAESIGELRPATSWTCYDLYPLAPELQDEPRWEKYRQFDGRRIPEADQTVDVALFCDVLHHIPGDLVANLQEAARVARRIVIKDHFEYSLYSRTVLQLMDVVGNWGYDISIPRRYFRRDGFLDLAARCGLRVTSLDVGIELYRHHPILHRILRPRWQFIAVLEPASD